MDLRAYQEKVRTFVTENNIDTTIEIRLIDLYSEIGELSKEILKGNSYGKKDFKPTKDIKGEIGDVLFSFICVANILDIDLGEALESVLNKYKRRFDEKGDIGSGR
jgi:NTP pyrophosphatase (non-canonical NTP hydrolase)